MKHVIMPHNANNRGFFRPEIIIIVYWSNIIIIIEPPSLHSKNTAWNASELAKWFSLRDISIHSARALSLSPLHRVSEGKKISETPTIRRAHHDDPTNFLLSALWGRLESYQPAEVSD